MWMPVISLSPSFWKPPPSAPSRPSAVATLIYLCFALSAVLGSVAELGLYRGTFPQW